jgi:hypothetical protein
MAVRRISPVSNQRPVIQFAAAFVALPTAHAKSTAQPQAASMLEIYRIAYEQACELHKPSRWAPLYGDNPN